MHHLQTLFLLTLVFAYTSAPAAFAAAPPPSARFASVEADGCKMDVELPNAPMAGSPVYVRVKITNTGKAPVMVRWETNEPLPFDLELKTAGKPVPLTRYGVKKIAPTELLDQLQKLRGSIRGHTLRPGETTNLDLPNLALFYDLTVPSDYDLNIRPYVTVGEGASAKGVRLRVKRLRLTISNP